MHTPTPPTRIEQIIPARPGILAHFADGRRVAVEAWALVDTDGTGCGKIVAPMGIVAGRLADLEAEPGFDGVEDAAPPPASIRSAGHAA